ncbi:hypothetical protein [Sphingobium mellinum]|uniref:hypothetical protein n=1 Tax=Sphingobium mellinum TaxID=1387166 RepID=UPI0030ECFB04
MAEDGRRGEDLPDGEPPDSLDDLNDIEAARGTGLIFLLVALALILAIGFFYMTKDREPDQGRVLTEAAESADSAARVVGDAAQKAADKFERN